jgi:hypothetical protein
MEANGRRLRMVILVLVVEAGVLGYLGGCKSSDRVVATETNSQCPNCRMETRIQPLTGLTYTTCICPVCKKVSRFDPETRERVQDIFGHNLGDSVYVCDNCQMVVEKCAICRAKEEK